MLATSLFSEATVVVSISDNCKNSDFFYLNNILNKTTLHVKYTTDAINPSNLPPPPTLCALLELGMTC